MARAHAAKHHPFFFNSHSAQIHDDEDEDDGQDYMNYG